MTQRALSTVSLLTAFSGVEQERVEQERLFEEIGKRSLDLPLEKARRVLEEAQSRVSGKFQARIARVLDHMKAGETRPEVLALRFRAGEEGK